MHLGLLCSRHAALGYTYNDYISYICSFVIQRYPSNQPVQHVHIAEVPTNYVHSQHTVYSFHSQSLYKDEVEDGTSKPTSTLQNGGNGTVLSNCTGRVLELRPVASVPAKMDIG